MNNGANAHNGSCAFVTGAASGIGLSTARLFVEREWSVVLVDSDADRGQAAAHGINGAGKAFFVQCDVGRSDEVRRAVAASIQRFGRIHVLVNNAALLGPGDLLASSDSDLEHVLAVDLFGPLCVSKYLIDHMIKAGEGTIINVASISCFTGSPNYPAYAASKAGLIGLTRSLARRYARHNVRVNCLCPGSVRDTELRFRSTHKRYSAEEELSLMKKIPIGRTLRPREVAELIFFLASPAAAAMTGSTIVLDGGEMLGL